MAGLWFEEYEVGRVYRHKAGRTVTETDNLLFTTLSMNPAPLHLDAEYCKTLPYGRQLVTSVFTIGVIMGMSVSDLFEGTSLGNLGFTKMIFPNPVFIGDTLRSETEIADKRESKSRPEAGIISVVHRGYNQRDELVMEAHRAGLSLKRPAGRRIMMQATSLKICDYLRADDLVVVEQGVGEPSELVSLLVEQRESLPGTEVFIGLSYAGLLTAEAAKSLRVVSFGAMASLAQLAAAGLLGVIPCAYADVSRVLEARAAAGFAVLIQVSPAGADGCHSLGVGLDYTHELLASARVVIAEINDQMPPTTGPRIPGSLFTAAVHTSRPLPEVPTPVASELHRSIAASAAEIVPERATLQLGIGAVPSVVGGLLAQRRDLRVHSALVGDWLLELSDHGALSQEPGAVVVSGAAGSRRLYEYLATGDVTFEPIPRLSPPDVIANIPRFVAMNSALQVDLSGQVNAELVGNRYLGGIGGQPDFLRGAQLSPGGRSIIMLPATAARGTKSRIVTHLDQGVVTTARSGVDFIVTEFGIADLRGKTLQERAQALIAVAAPEHRDALAEAGADMDKVIGSAAQAVADIRSGSSLAVGGFGVCGVPVTLIDALLEAGATDLEIVSNNCGLDDVGLGLLLRRGRIRRAVSSYVGENAEFARRYLTGELELELTPQGTLAERLRAGGAGIPAFYTRAGAGTAIADGGMPWRYAPDGSVAVASPAKETRTFNGAAYVLEAAIRCDFALVRAAVADRRGNLSFHESAGNFNPLCAMAGAVAIAEGETIVDALPPDRIDLPGVFVQRVVQADSRPKLIERRTIRKRGSEV